MSRGSRRRTGSAGAGRARTTLAWFTGCLQVGLGLSGPGVVMQGYGGSYRIATESRPFSQHTRPDWAPGAGAVKKTWRLRILPALLLFQCLAYCAARDGSCPRVRFWCRESSTWAPATSKAEE